jgi:lysophospholipase L1-like esterase
MRWGSFVAVGDSYTEGLDDPYDDGTYRGWADLVATGLGAAAGADFRYANLAIRGRLFPSVVTEQVPVALDMSPDLISFAAGGNDMLRRTVPLAVLERFGEVVAQLRATGADVLLLRFPTGVPGQPCQGWVASRLAILNRVVAQVSERTGALLVDLAADDEFLNPALWSTDRLHLSAAGHRRAAAHVLTVLGVECDPAWLLAPPQPEPTHWLTARAADLRWAGQHFAPWIGRRMTGRSSGDLVTAKRPILSPVGLPALAPSPARDSVTVGAADRGVPALGKRRLAL